MTTLKQRCSRIGVLLICISAFLFWVIDSPTPAAFADNMNSSSYKLFFGNFNITSGQKDSTSYTVTDTVGQTAPGQYGLTGSVVKSGFQYLYPFETFSFKIDPLTVDLGTLTIQSFATATQSLEVTAIGAGGYSVYAYEDHPLKQVNAGSAVVPDTLCDTTCSETTAAVWTNTTKYGFGYNMSVQDIPAAFVNSTYYKQFADKSSGESAQVVMSRSGVGTRRRAVVTYKANISASQAAGEYQTQIVFIAVPGY